MLPKYSNRIPRASRNGVEKLFFNNNVKIIFLIIELTKWIVSHLIQSIRINILDLIAI